VTAGAIRDALDVANKVARKSNWAARSTWIRVRKHLTFDPTPTLKSCENPETKRARQDSNL
jgi:hypothetical protein